MNKKLDLNSLFKYVVILLSGALALFNIWISYYIKFNGNIPWRNYYAFTKSYPFLVMGFILINILFGTYIYYNKSKSDIIFITFLSQVLLTIFIMALSYAGQWYTFPRSVVLLNFILGFLVMTVFNLLVYWIYLKLRGTKRIMIIGQSSRVLEAVRNFDLMNSPRHQVTHIVLNRYFDNIKKYHEEVDTVYLAGYLDESEKLKIYEYLMRHNKQLFISTEFENLMMVNTNIMNFQDESIIEVSPFQLSSEDAMLKRLFDIVLSFVLIVLTSPIMIATMIAIKLDTPGPIFYKQERVTLNQRTFNILKFRSMDAHAEKESGPVLASSNDERVTRVGKLIRSTRIDELPQLLNVLKGDMSIVGPRPERPFFVEQFKKQNPYYALRHHVRAGITGFAQVYGKYSTDFNSKLNFDLLYIKKYSLIFDFKLTLQTVKIVFDKVSSRGLDEIETAVFDWDNYREIIKIID